MSTRMLGLVRGSLAVVVVLVLVGAVAIGQRTADLSHLGLQLAAVAGLLVLLWSYNRSRR